MYPSITWFCIFHQSYTTRRNKDRRIISISDPGCLNYCRKQQGITRLCSSDFSESIESGARVDVSLTDGSDYSKFYDNTVLISTLKDLFGDEY
ncbi:MAG: hypothetical protein K6F15_11015 [Treponema sp.]|nr:hypothetical protein [Treponema sp.]